MQRLLCHVRTARGGEHGRTHPQNFAEQAARRAATACHTPSASHCPCASILAVVVVVTVVTVRGRVNAARACARACAYHMPSKTLPHHARAPSGCQCHFHTSCRSSHSQRYFRPWQLRGGGGGVHRYGVVCRKWPAYPA